MHAFAQITGWVKSHLIRAYTQSSLHARLKVPNCNSIKQIVCQYFARWWIYARTHHLYRGKRAANTLFFVHLTDQINRYCIEFWTSNQTRFFVLVFCDCAVFALSSHRAICELFSRLAKHSSSLAIHFRHSIAILTAQRNRHVQVIYCLREQKDSGIALHFCADALVWWFEVSPNDDDNTHILHKL